MLTAYECMIAVVTKYTDEPVPPYMMPHFEGGKKSGRLVYEYHGEGISLGCYEGEVILTYRGVTRHYQVRELWGHIAVKEV